jgi:hypothetical protein
MSFTIIAINDSSQKVSFTAGEPLFNQVPEVTYACSLLL